MAGRILLRYGVLDAFGHVSARHPDRPDRFLMTRRIAPGLATIADIRPFGLDGEMADGLDEPAFLERYIHSAIYAARPDVRAVVHSHSHSVIAFGAVPNQPLRPICHTCGFLADEAPVFEIRDVAGDDSNMLIQNQALGEALAHTLGSAPLVLMRGHGSTVVGNSVPQAVYRAIYMEGNAQVQAAAQRMGTPIFLTPAEARACEKDSQLALERTWAFWVDQATSAQS